MFKINEAYAVLSNEEKRGDYDNTHMLNGGSSIELVPRKHKKNQCSLLMHHLLNG